MSSLKNNLTKKVIRSYSTSEQSSNYNILRAISSLQNNQKQIVAYKMNLKIVKFMTLNQKILVFTRNFFLLKKKPQYLSTLVLTLQLLLFLKFLVKFLNAWDMVWMKIFRMLCNLTEIPCSLCDKIILEREQLHYFPRELEHCTQCGENGLIYK